MPAITRTKTNIDIAPDFWRRPVLSMAHAE